MIDFQLRRLKKKRKVPHPSPKLSFILVKEPVLLAAKYCTAFHSVHSQGPMKAALMVWVTDDGNGGSRVETQVYGGTETRQH